MAHYVATPSLDIGAAISLFFNRIFSIQGRSRRSEFWWVMLMVFVVNIFFNFINISLAIIHTSLYSPAFNILPILLWSITIPLQIRRLHDSGSSGWWLVAPAIVTVVISIVFLIQLIAIGGNNENAMLMAFLGLGVPTLILLILFVSVFSVIMIIFFCMDSQMGDNKYGPSPKYILTEGSAPTFMGMNGAQMYAHTTTKSPEM